MLAPEQSRAARAWLNWSQEDLAVKAEVSLSTVRDFEKGKRVPIRHNLAAIRFALEGGGVRFEFNSDDSPLGIIFDPEK
jgi:transcriptional regulator with XRE-family HTH domain